MTPNPEDLAAQYAQLSETELMKMARSYDAGLSRRWWKSRKNGSCVA
jgi:hypothetical protein